MAALWRWLILLGIRPARGLSVELRAWLCRAGRGGPAARRVWWVVVIAAVGGMLAALGYVGARLAHFYLWESEPETLDDVMEDLGTGNWAAYAIAWGAAAVLTGLAIILVRVIWLNLGVRRALVHRDRCAFCGHGLVGVPLSGPSAVTCSECGRESPIVAEWDEVDAAKADRPVFRPGSGLVRVFWTRRRLVWTARAAAAIVVLAGLGYGGWWTVREIGIRREAAKARADRLGSDALNAKIRGTVPARPVDTPLIAELVVTIADRLRQGMTSFWNAHQSEISGLGEYLPEPSILTSTWVTSDDPRAPLARRLTVDLMRSFEEDGLYSLMDQLPAASPWSDRRISTIDESAELGSPGNYRSVLRFCIARMTLAREAEDIAEFQRALAAAIAIANALDQGPLLIDCLVARAADDSILRDASAILMNRPDRGWLEAIRPGVEQLRPSSLGRVMANDRLVFLDSLAWYFAEPSRVRKGLLAPELDDKFGIGAIRGVRLLLGVPSEGPEPRLGSYSENRLSIDAAYTAAGEQADLDAWQRRDRPELPDESNLVFLDSILPSLTQSMRSGDRGVLRFRSVRVMLALEQHRLDNGDYPDSLDPIASSSNEPHMLDPFSGKPFGYRRVDPASDPHQRGFLLWTVGYDGVDNGGTVPDRNWDAALRPAGEGTDMILNDPRW